MSKKRALVVDDSKLARYVMKKMLTEYGMDVDTVESAEEALGYLSHRKCDIVFMDQMMPGMDGLEAVKAIKDDPVTANIPVMMYTSKGGEVFVGQARKLGAYGVMSKQVKPVELFKVLRKLQLISQTKTPPATAGASAAPPTLSADYESLDDGFVEPSQDTIEAIATVAAESVEQNSFPSQVKRLLNEQNQFIRREFSRHTRRLIEQQWEGGGETAGPSGPNSFFWQTARLVIAALVVMFPTLLYVKFSSPTDSLPNDNANTALHELKLKNQQLTNTKERLREALHDALKKKQLMLSALIWAVNTKGEYAFEQNVADGEHSQSIISLLDRLGNAGYQGQVIVEAHMGDFCVQGNINDGFKVAPDETPMKECQTLKQLPDNGKLLADKQNYAFEQFLTRPTLRGSEEISVSGVFHGLEKNVYDYPALGIVDKAGEWNSTARRNNRIVVTLVPDDEWLEGGLNIVSAAGM